MQDSENREKLTHTHIHKLLLGLLYFLTRGKHHSCLCFLSWPLASSPREPRDCALIFITETSCQNEGQRWGNGQIGISQSRAMGM